MPTDGDVRMPAQADRAEHVVEPAFNVTTHRGDLVGHVFQDEELMRINRAVPDETGVDVRQDAAPELKLRTGEHVRLECKVVEVNVLHAGGAFYLDQIPQAARSGIQDVSPGVAAVEGEGGFIKRAALLDGLF